MRSVLVALAFCCFVSVVAAEPIRIGSKNFPESYLLAEIMSQLLEAEGFTVERRFGLGGTLICYEALQRGEIDIYPEYTGTLTQSILEIEDRRDLLDARLADEGLALLGNIGFNNTYAMVVRGTQAEELGLTTIGDLRGHALDVVVSHEFIDREDGWPGLRVRYQLDHGVTGIEHSLAYQALREGAIDVTDAYSTDGEIERYDLKVLLDDLDYFPQYFAAPLVRSELDPDAVAALGVLAGSISDAAMQALNSKVVFEQRPEREVAAEFLQSLGVEASADSGGWLTDLAKNTLRHLQLTGIALFAAVAFGMSISLLIYGNPALANGVIYVCGLMQTIPSIALLALLIPVFGIGFAPAIVALFLYSLLPIVRNTVTALVNIEPTLVRVATAIGLSDRERLRHVLIPLSLPSIFAGIRTAAVISIGTATLAAFIGAGGLGDPIVSGLARVDVGLILQGAVPAALLAIVTEILFEAIEKWSVRRT